VAVAKPEDAVSSAEPEVSLGRACSPDSEAVAAAPGSCSSESEDADPTAEADPDSIAPPLEDAAAVAVANVVGKPTSDPDVMPKPAEPGSDCRALPVSDARIPELALPTSPAIPVAVALENTMPVDVATARDVALVSSAGTDESSDSTGVAEASAPAPTPMVWNPLLEGIAGAAVAVASRSTEVEATGRKVSEVSVPALALALIVSRPATDVVLAAAMLLSPATVLSPSTVLSPATELSWAPAEGFSS
jgi:hypothetical protein